MSEPFCIERRVEFRDTDAAGIMHFSTFFNRMEEAEHEFLRTRGLSVIMPEAGGHLSWPRVSVQCDYRKPARFEDRLAVELRVEKIGTKSITYDTLFRVEGEAIAHGRMTAVCCLFVPGAAPRAIEIPPAIRAKLSG